MLYHDNMLKHVQVSENSNCSVFFIIGVHGKTCYTMLTCFSVHQGMFLYHDKTCYNMLKHVKP